MSTAEEERFAKRLETAFDLALTGVGILAVDRFGLIVLAYLVPVVLVALLRGVTWEWRQP